MKYFESYNLPGDNLRQRQLEWAIWYSGVPERIANYYDDFLNTFSPRGGAQNVKFWGAQNTEERNDFVHLPIAGDIAAVSANLLFSEPPEIEVEKNDERFKEMLQENKFGQRIIHASEIASAVGGVYLKVDTQQAESEYPIVTIRYPDSAIPDFKSNGDLRAVRFHRVIKQEKKYYRLYEGRRVDSEGLHVEFELKELKDGKDSKTVSLTTVEETKDLQDATFPGYNKLGVVYIPNMLPNRQFPKSHEGISDYASVISLMDSLDESWTSWMNDLTIGQGRVFVDTAILDMTDGKFKYDPYKRVIIKADMGSAHMGEGYKPIENIQFDIRAEEHLTTCQSLTEQIITLCGYSPQSFGMEINGQAESGTALRIRERKSMLTKQKKSRYWMNGLEDFLTQVQEIDVRAGLASYTPERPSVSIADSIVHDPKEVSETIRNLDQARAASTFAKVKMANEDWTDEQIQEEVNKINSEQGAIDVPVNMVGG